ncbi:MAG TPA: GNAT family N-acetyltransferase [Saprospiraceae bacterium]|nr:GNAT family N-acetyltransferase [Saprospiraceae bacterium]HNT21174.1 GNAT family N-acetyltransferase [Saprospiraceae bacterium]
MNSSTFVRKASLEDLASLLDLVRELAVYEKAPEAVTATLQDYEKNYLEGVFDALVAVDREGAIVGTAIYYVCFSTWKGRMLYLEDFVVKESLRGLGTGRLLFDALLQEAVNLDCRLVKWQVLEWNEPALNFYGKYQAIIEKEWWNGKIFVG